MRDDHSQTTASTPDSVKVSLGGIELLPALQPMWERLFDHHAASGAAGLPVRSRDESWPLRHESYEEIFAEQPAFVLIAHQGSHAVGYVVAYADEPIEEAGDGPIVTIETLVVLPEMRDKGLGGWLLQEAEAEAIEQWGAEVTALEVMVGNESGEGFFNRASFVERGETWLRTGITAHSETATDYDRLDTLLDTESELFAIGLEEGPDDTWLTSEVLVVCQPEATTAANEATLEATLAPFAEAGAVSTLVALDGSNDPAWGEALAALGFRKVLRLLTRSIGVE